HRAVTLLCSLYSTRATRHLPSFPTRRSSDLGGTGSFLLAILRRHAALHGTLFELPGACEVARRRLAGEPEGARIDVVEGDLDHRSEEHTSELQSQSNLVCRLLLEKKNKENAL